MDQHSAGLTNANRALVVNGGLANQALDESFARHGLSHGPVAFQLPGDITGVTGHRSERLLTLLVALEALRAAPEVLEPGQCRNGVAPKV